MAYKTAIQLILIVISAVIIMTYIKPTFEDMRMVQDETQEYRDAFDNAAKFNQELRRLAAVANEFSASELAALDRYLPADVDTVRVMRDIETIVENNGITLIGLSSGEAYQGRSVTMVGETPAENQEQLALTTHPFNVSVISTYEQFKLLLQDFERNIYPLEITEIGFSSSDEPTYSFTIVLETYSLDVTAE